MKVHAGVDAGSGYVHTITGTAANVHDVDETANLLREDDKVCYGDSGYIGAKKRPEIQDNEHFKDIEFRTNARPSNLKISSSYKGINWDKEIENRKSSVRCRVEHVFLIVKRQFGYAKVAYWGIAKNMNRFHILFASANLVKCFRAGRTMEFCRV
jgi:IS5 family transposase